MDQPGASGWLSRRGVWVLLAVHVLALLVGTLMPNAWRTGIVQGLHAPSVVSSWAHFVLFAGMALLLLLRPVAWPVWRVLLAGLALALLSEGLQFFAMDRHPRWRDVGIDMAGVVLAVVLVKGARVCNVRE